MSSASIDNCGGSRRTYVNLSKFLIFVKLWIDSIPFLFYQEYRLTLPS
jgi:hypothetical protein